MSAPVPEERRSVSSPRLTLWLEGGESSLDVRHFEVREAISAPFEVRGKVVDPDGKVVQDVKTRDEFVTVPVPAGMDGKPWSFAKLDLGHLWFFNVPNCLAASPQALLVPRELAEQDGLPVR